MTLKPLREYRFSLRTRATSWYVGLLAVALVVFSIAIYVGIRTYLKVTLQRELAGKVQTIATKFLPRLADKGDTWVIGEVRESYDSTPIDEFVRISVGRATLFRTADLIVPPTRLSDISLPLLSDVGAYHRQSINGNAVMTYSLPFTAPDGRIFEIEAGTALFNMGQTLHTLVKILWSASILILVCAAFGGYWLMKQPLMPLVVLTEKAANIGRKELGERLPVIPTGDELERLTHSLNGMIDRLEDALNHNHRFSADASHELRTPLTIMRGEMEELLRMDDLPPQAIENLVSTLDEVDRMSRIVNSLMAITRLDAGGERMDMQQIDLSALVRTTVEHMQLIAEEKNLPLSCAAEREVYVYADPMRMKQVLVNLIDNAIKYTTGAAPAADTTSTARKRSGNVDVTVFTSGDHVNLRVADQGVGISPEALPHVFDRFYRADYARSRGAGGVGLGLAIVKAIVTAHEGTVSITSTEGQGSTVLVQLPLVSRGPSIAHEEAPAVNNQVASNFSHALHSTRT